MTVLINNTFLCANDGIVISLFVQKKEVAQDDENMIKTIYKTNRLSLENLTSNDAPFILELVNTPGWLQFIGDRNVRNEEDALAYIQKIQDNLNVTYWVVKLNTNKASIGIITFIKRDYLEHSDIGFAFLPQYGGQGYAFEAADVVLKNLTEDGKHNCILATTLKENVNSIKLLEKLGFDFEKEIEKEEEVLMVYNMTTLNPF